jgi:hypothetical protein
MTTTRMTQHLITQTLGMDLMWIIILCISVSTIQMTEIVLIWTMIVVMIIQFAIGNVHMSTLNISKLILRPPDANFYIPNANQTKFKLIFLKSHKTASSTVIGIFWRNFCLHSDYNCFLPPHSNPGRTWDFDRLDHQKFVFSSQGTAHRGVPFDIWLYHAKNHKTLFDLLGFNQSPVFVSIIRRPALRFQSAWYWYDLAKVYGGSVSLSVSFIRMIN